MSTLVLQLLYVCAPERGLRAALRGRRARPRWSRRRVGVAFWQPQRLAAALDADPRVDVEASVGSMAMIQRLPESWRTPRRLQVSCGSGLRGWRVCSLPLARPHLSLHLGPVHWKRLTPVVLLHDANLCNPHRARRDNTCFACSHCHTSAARRRVPWQEDERPPGRFEKGAAREARRPG